MAPGRGNEQIAGDADDALKNDKPIRIMIADDHPVVREGLCAILDRQPDMEVVAEAGGGLAAVEQFARQLPDILLMDLRMPDLAGDAAALKIRSCFPAAKIVILSAYEGEEEICRAVLAGAEGFVSKGAPREELMGCIREVYAGKRWIPSEVASALERRLAATDLSHDELDVVNLMAFGKSNQEIGEALHLPEETVKTRVEHILAKFGVAGRSEGTARDKKPGIVNPR